MKCIRPSETQDPSFAVTFEVITDIDFHEQGVALDALGTLTCLRRLKPTHVQPAYLGTAIAKAKVHTEEGTEKSVLIPTEHTLSADDLTVLHEALVQYQEDTPAAIRHMFSMGNPHAANVRAVEGDMALGMIEEILAMADVELTNWRPRPVGFR